MKKGNPIVLSGTHEETIHYFLKQKLMSFLGLPSVRSGYSIWSELKLHKEQILKHLGIESTPDILELSESNFQEFMERILIQSQFPNAVEALKAFLHTIDTRDLAMEHWGWKRVSNDNIQTWELTPKDMRIISTGMEEILPENESDEILLNIEFFKPYNKVYEEVPLKVIKQGNPYLLKRFYDADRLKR